MSSAEMLHSCSSHGRRHSPEPGGPAADPDPPTQTEPAPEHDRYMGLALAEARNASQKPARYR